MAIIVSAREVSKIFLRRESGGAPTTALDAVTLDVAEREVVVLFGERGAGKTTLLKVILDILQPSAGEITVFGFATSDWMWKADVGYLPQSFLVKTKETGESFLRFIGELRDMRACGKLDQRIKNILRRLGLRGVGNSPVSQYTRDMMIRLGIAQAFLHDPRFVVLDEPTKELEQENIHTLCNLLGEFRTRGGSVLLSSTQLTDVEMVADRIVVIHQGRIERVFPPRKLRTPSRNATGNGADAVPLANVAQPQQANVAQDGGRGGGSPHNAMLDGIIWESPVSGSGNRRGAQRGTYVRRH